MADFPDYTTFENLAWIEEEYRRYTENPESVDPSWRHFFEGIDFAGFLHRRPAPQGTGCAELRVFGLIQAYRRYGHLVAPPNPIEDVSEKADELDLEKLGFSQSELEASFPTLGLCGKETAPLKEIIAALKDIYCSRIGFEFMDLGNPEIEKWIQKRIEPKLVLELSAEEKQLLLGYLNKSEVFETFLNSHYPGQTRFSIEGNETAIPMLAEVIERGSELGIDELWIGMAHRGRLNVLANILNKPYAAVLEEFEDDTTLSFFGSDDVKYHLGFTGEFAVKSGKKVSVSFPANPSHLESVDPVLLGQTRAVQILKNDREGAKVLPVLIHGDAAVAGQGVVYESLQLMRLENYAVGGSVHIVLNNQIGYTTLPKEGRSTRYCTDIAKTFGIPVFHVNAEDPESCLFVAKLAIEIRQKFHIDVFIDLLGYRKYGHNEGDEPSYTQPTQYKLIRSKKTIREIYYETLVSSGYLEKKIAEALESEFRDTMKKALSEAQGKSKTPAPVQPAFDIFKPVETGVKKEILKEIAVKFCTVPEGFHLHPKLQKQLQKRVDEIEGNVDWSTAESLAFGSLLLENHSVRLAGQDSRRGTFSQRHMIWSDAENGSSHCPLCSMRPGQQGRCDIVNSPLSEYAGLGFEYGYSLSATGALVLWEAQYGDFFNGAQIIIDQYIVSAERKWNTPSSLVLLLPHGFEGAGPEHSSARIERFLQLCADDNIQVVNASTPAQYFHLLRRQVARKVKKPLVVFTPKSLLRAKANVSPIQDFLQGSFHEVLDDPTPPKEPKRLLICSGKAYYDLSKAREESQAGAAILRIEQIYPLAEEELKKLIAKYKTAKEIVWMQEEPENMGAWSHLAPKLQNLVPEGAVLKCVARPKNSTPATGSNRIHKKEQKELIENALKEGPK